MNKVIMGVAAALFLTMGILGAQRSVADGDDEGRGRGRTDVAPVTNASYIEECGSCHMAYQPGLLPARSWRKLMDGLADHFGDSAELEPDQRSRLTQYLVENSADNSSYRRSRKMVRSLRGGEAPIAITKVPYFVRKHDEIPRRMVRDNPKVKSLSNCMACHRRADKGSYSEREIDIPGFGRWEDD